MTHRLYQGDCREVLKWLSYKDDTFDAVFVDFPYANDTQYDGYDDDEDNLAELVHTTMPILRRVGRVVAVTCGVSNMHRFPPPTWVLAWYSPGGVGSGPWGFCSWQPILVYGPDPYLAAGKGRRPDTIEFNGASESNGHPCPKPVALMQRILARISFEGDMILDPMMGSGTTGVACMNTNRNFVGIEQSPEYFAIAAKRIESAAVKPQLFGAVDVPMLRRWDV